MKLKGKSLKRAMKTKENYRLIDDVPLIQDSTELVSPEKAKKLLNKNGNNRPVNWNRVNEYANQMKEGKWRLIAQGIVLDKNGNILTGQCRLHAVIRSNTSQYFRISKGNPFDTIHLLDRGAPQSSRDLAYRKTQRKHSPVEASLARAILAKDGKLKPKPDDIAEIIVNENEIFEEVINGCRGIRKTKSLLMIMASIANTKRLELLGHAELLSKRLEKEIFPVKTDECWGRGAGFSLAMNKAINICQKATTP